MDLAAFVRACELQEACKGLSLLSYLIMPVQRIPRYELLLAEVHKYTDREHEDYLALTESLAVMSGVVASINDDVDKQERRFKVVEIQEKFKTTLVAPSRTFLRDGLLTKICEKGPRKIFFVLFNGKGRLY